MTGLRAPGLDWLLMRGLPQFFAQLQLVLSEQACEKHQRKKKERQTDRASVRKKASKMVAAVFSSLHRRDILSLLPYSIHQKHVNGSSPYSKRELHKSVNTRRQGALRVDLEGCLAHIWN